MGDTPIKVLLVEDGVPILVLTGLEDGTLAVKAVQDGAQGYVINGQMNGNLLAQVVRYLMYRQRRDWAANGDRGRDSNK